MTYATVENLTPDQIPVIDIETLFSDHPDYAGVGAALKQAAEVVGFFYVRGHCIQPKLVESTFELSKQFFALPQQQKLSVRAEGYHRGLLPLGDAKMEGQANSDLKESFIWGVDFDHDNPEFAAGNELMPPNRWPAFLPEMRNTLGEYMRAAHDCGIQLLRAIAASLEIERDYFVGRFERPISRGSLIHYPPQPPTMGKDQFGVSPHTDYGTMTLLAQDSTGGLRVKGVEGNWLTAHPIEGTIVVNVGDLLARWSNDRFRSTPHSVVNASGKERYSIAIALDPDWDTLIRPVVTEGESSHYGDVLCGDYIRGRFDRSFSYRQPTLS
ncbi:MAG: isopenicillin N synthase family dioxygenase [bacterium]